MLAFILLGVQATPVSTPSRDIIHHRKCNRKRHRCRRHKKPHLAATVTYKYHNGILFASPFIWPWPSPYDPSSPGPTGFVDPSGTYSFNCGTDFSVGATVNLCQNGHAVGVYIDDTTPNITDWLSLALQKYSLVVEGQAPNGPCYDNGQALCAQEWYPYDCRYPPNQWGPIPSANAYILQWNYAWPGCGPPTPNERQYLLSLVQSLHPRLILLY